VPTSVEGAPPLLLAFGLRRSSRSLRFERFDYVCEVVTPDVLGRRRQRSSQIAAKLPMSCGMRAGRAMNRRCSPPSPQRQTCTRPISPTERTARSIRAIRTPSSAASWSGRSPARRSARAARVGRQPASRSACRSPETPALVRPQVVAVGRCAPAAIHPALTESRRLALDRRSQRPRPHLTVERERLPGLDRRHSQRVGGASVELFGVSAIGRHDG
jgi:hypothetical protein